MCTFVSARLHFLVVLRGLPVRCYLFCASWAPGAPSYSSIICLQVPSLKLAHMASSPSYGSTQASGPGSF